jgi:hypothetical protein
VIDYEELQNRLIVLYEGRIAQSFAIGHLLEHLRFLDVAVDDFDAAHTELREVLGGRARVMASFEDLAEAVEALRGEPHDALVRAGVRFHYRVESAYAVARRVLDRVVVVAHELLPRAGTQTNLGNSHHGFGPRLVKRCSELGLAVPESLQAQIEDLASRIKDVRDEIEHPMSPLWVRWTEAGRELKVGTRKVVPVGEDAARADFEPVGVLREAIHTYVLAMVELLELAASRRRNPDRT